MSRVSAPAVPLAVTLSISLLALAALAALAACASSRGVVEDPRAPVKVLRGGAVIVDDAPEIADAVLAAPADRVWESLLTAYQELGVQVEYVDSRSRTLGNRDFRIRRDLGGVRASEYFDCGYTVTGMPAADSYRIETDLTTRVVAAAPDSTLLITSVSGFAHPVSGASSDGVRCASRGNLENRIVELVVENLPAGE